jgi:serine/threonine-protein kinase
MAAFPGVGDTLGRYEIVRRIGRGGMGTVFEARQVDLGRPVALKVLSSEFADDPDFRARFAREARMLATLDSPHVIQVFETGEEHGEFFIATQLVHGRDLLELLRAEGPLPAAAALRVVGQVASALADAHEAGILHRDVKPSNVLIRESRADHFAYLCDFGIARHADSAHTRTGGVLGTLSYLAPECHEGADASPSSDLYSLGCVLWAALTGRAPFERTSEYQLALAHLRAEIPVYVGDSRAASQINAILRQSMAKSPQDRFESAGAMHAALLEAEEIARGLHRGAVGDTELGSAPRDHDRTQVRIAQPARGPGTVDVGRSVGRRRATRAFAVWAVAGVAVLVLAGTAVALLRGPAADRTAAVSPPTTAASSPTTKASSSRAPRPRRAASRQPARVASSTPPAGTPTPVVGPLTSHGVNAVGCWDGGAASSAQTCPEPVAFRGLRTVFPSMEDSCRPVGTRGVEGKAEAFECEYGRYMIRYSRWTKQADRYAYLDAANPDALHPRWIISGVPVGRIWESHEDSPNEDKKYQWSATYRGNPYEVSVEGVDPAARQEGVSRVIAVLPRYIGLP